MTGEMRVMMAPQDEPDAYEGASAFTATPKGLRDRSSSSTACGIASCSTSDSLALVEKLDVARAQRRSRDAPGRGARRGTAKTSTRRGLRSRSSWSISTATSKEWSHDR